MAAHFSLSSVAVWQTPPFSSQNDRRLFPQSSSGLTDTSSYPHNRRVSLFRGIQLSNCRYATNSETSPKNSVRNKPANALCVQHKWPNRKWLATVVT
jgi:hypothetical protein